MMNAVVKPYHEMCLNSSELIVPRDTYQRALHPARVARTAGVSLPGKTKYLQQVYTIYNGGSRRAALPLKF